MILVTVGAQMAFDRMISAVDQWAESRGRGDVFAQVGPGSYVPRHIRWTRFLEPLAFRSCVEQASAVVAHAGMGSIITALELGKPILVMPRRGDLKETRNDHQFDTAKHFLAQGRISVALDERELSLKLDTLERLTAQRPVEPQASPQLLQAVRRFIENGELASEDGRFDGIVLIGGQPGGALEVQLARQWPTLCVSLGAPENRGLPAVAAGFLRGLARRYQAPPAGRSGAAIGSLQVAPAASASGAVVRRIRRAAAGAGIRLPLLWVTDARAARLVGRLPHVVAVYQPGAHDSQTAQDHAWLMAHADVTLFGTFEAFERESSGCRRPLWIGCDAQEIGQYPPGVFDVLRELRARRIAEFLAPLPHAAAAPALCELAVSS